MTEEAAVAAAMRSGCSVPVVRVVPYRYSAERARFAAPIAFFLCTTSRGSLEIRASCNRNEPINHEQFFDEISTMIYHCVGNKKTATTKQLNLTIVDKASHTIFMQKLIGSCYGVGIVIN